jgi:hypothetical protein
MPSFAESTFPSLNKVDVSVNTSNFKSVNVGGSTTDMKKEQQSSFQVKYDSKPKEENQRSNSQAAKPSNSKSPEGRKKYH